MNSLYLEEFFLYLTNEKRYSTHTISAYQNDLYSFFHYVKKENIQEINYIVIQSYFSSLYVENISMKTISRKLSSIKSYGKFLSKTKSINCDFLKNVILPKKEKKLPEFLHDEELTKLLNLPCNNFLQLRNSLIINLLYSTGLRLSELTNLKCSDYNQSENIFKVKGKGNKERIVIFSNKSKQLLDDYLKERLMYDGEFLLINKNHKKLTNRGVENILTNISKQYLGHEKLHPHMLRHTFATKLLNKGMDLRALQELLGHESLNATQIYTHLAKNQLSEIYRTYHPRGENDDL